MPLLLDAVAGSLAGEEPEPEELAEPEPEELWDSADCCSLEVADPPEPEVELELLAVPAALEEFGPVAVEPRLAADVRAGSCPDASCT